MAEKKVGMLVKEARTAAGLTQEKLAKAAGEGLTAAAISKCERGEADLSTAKLKKIAVACGVTQKSLVEAPKNLSPAAAQAAAGKNSSSAKTGTAKTGQAAKASSAKKENAALASAEASLKLSGTEEKLIQAYRAATSDRKKAALKLLKGEYGETVDKILAVTEGSAASAATSAVTSGKPDFLGDSLGDSLGDLLGSMLGGLLGGK